MVQSRLDHVEALEEHLAKATPDEWLCSQVRHLLSFPASDDEGWTVVFREKTSTGGTARRRKSTPGKGGADVTSDHREVREWGTRRLCH